jgi:hypothetical protein
MRSVTVLLDCPPDAGLDDDSAFDASSRRQKRAHGTESHAAVIRAAIPGRAATVRSHSFGIG